MNSEAARRQATERRIVHWIEEENVFLSQLDAPNEVAHLTTISASDLQLISFLQCMKLKRHRFTVKGQSIVPRKFKQATTI